MRISKVISQLEVNGRYYEPKKCVIDNINRTLRECLSGTSFESIDNLTITVRKNEDGNRVINIEVDKYKIKNL